jgi:processive 1,2-diacylglycerol beta-glucosyltransferase
VATEELKSEMTAKSVVPSNRIEVTGIPVRSGFAVSSGYLRASASTARLSSDKPVVLVCAGSYGVLQQLEDIIRLLQHNSSCQLAVVCGRNERMRLKWETMFKDQPDVHVFGFVPDLHELMARSACMITKAGGVTLSEALAMRLPVFIYKPFPGQERENALYFEAKGIAGVASEPRELNRQITAVLQNPAVAKRISGRMMELSKGVAAELIVDDMVETLRQQVRITV